MRTQGFTSYAKQSARHHSLFLQVAIALTHQPADAESVLAEGRNILHTPRGEPLLAENYVFLSRFGGWYGGTVVRAPFVELVGRMAARQFCISIPVQSNDLRDICRIPISFLAKHSEQTPVSTAQVYIGKAMIIGRLKAYPKELSQDSTRRTNIRSALCAAKLDPNLCDTML